MTPVSEGGGRNGPPATSVGGGHLEERPRRTVGRAIPRWVARPQSPPPFHPAGRGYRRGGRGTRPRSGAGVVEPSSDGGGSEAGTAAVAGEVREGGGARAVRGWRVGSERVVSRNLVMVRVP